MVHLIGRIAANNVSDQSKSPKTVLELLTQSIRAICLQRKTVSKLGREGQTHPRALTNEMQLLMKPVAGLHVLANAGCFGTRIWRKVGKIERPVYGYTYCVEV